MNIATLSGGIMSFYTAYLSIQKYGKENVLLYFNDTKWEHSDLYRFLDDIKTYLDKDIFYDTDGRNPEQVFFDEHFLGCNRVPICSRILKAERLQKFYKDGDNLIFGIGVEEKHRVQRIVAAYQTVYARTGKFCTFWALQVIFYDTPLEFYFMRLYLKSFYCDWLNEEIPDFLM